MVLALKPRHTDQWSRTESPEINPCICRQLVFDKWVKYVQKRKDGLFHKWFWENWIFTHKRMELDSYLTSYTKMKWIKDLNVPETVKLLKNKKKREKFPWHWSSQWFFIDMTLKVQATKAKISWEYIKPKKLLYSKRNSQQNEKATYQMEKIVANYIPDKRLISKIYKMLI